MNITVAHFGTYYVDMPGVEKATCEFANAMVEKGHEVSILYIDQVEGSSYFPLKQEVKQINILFENRKRILSEKLSLPLRIAREVVRPFSQNRAREINELNKGRLYGKKIRHLID